MPSTEMSGPVASEEHSAEKDTSPKRPERDTEDDGNEASEHEDENDKEIGKENEKSEDKDSKAWQQDGDFAYEYVQLAQVRYAFWITLHLPITSITVSGNFPRTFSSIVILPRMNADVIAT
jgi:hypothetical protein